MSRVTEQQVLDIMPGTSLTARQIAPWLDVATTYVDAVLTDYSYSASVLEACELLLTAHLATTGDPEIVEEKIGDASVKYALGKMGGGFETTSYGRQLLNLEYKGVLKNISNAKEAATIEVVELDLGVDPL